MHFREYNQEENYHKQTIKKNDNMQKKKKKDNKWNWIVNVTWMSVSSESEREMDSIALHVVSLTTVEQILCFRQWFPIIFKSILTC